MSQPEFSKQALETMELLVRVSDEEACEICRGDDKKCLESRRGFVCTLLYGHRGEHVAATYGEVCLRWPEESSLEMKAGALAG